MISRGQNILLALHCLKFVPCVYSPRFGKSLHAELGGSIFLAFSSHHSYHPFLSSCWNGCHLCPWALQANTFDCVSQFSLVTCGRLGPTLRPKAVTLGKLTLAFSLSSIECSLFYFFIFFLVLVILQFIIIF